MQQYLPYAWTRTNIYLHLSMTGLVFPSLSCFWFHLSNNKDTVLKGEMSFFEYNSMAATR